MRAVQDSAPKRNHNQTGFPMTEAEARDAAQDTLAIAADTMAHDFVAAFLQELRGMPDHWARINAERQQAILEKLKEKIRAGTGRAVQIMLRSEFPAVQADLESITWKNGLSASLKIPKDALYRHQVCDAVGTAVLVVVADPGRWFGRMDEIKAKDDQLDMFEGGAADIDPKIDQPAYRRDQDRTITGPTWADLKKQLNVGKKDEEPEEKPAIGVQAEWPADKQAAYEEVFARIYGKSVDELSDDERTSEAVLKAHEEAVNEVEPLVFASAATPEQEKQAKARMLQEELAAIGCAVSAGAVNSWSADEQRVVREWLAAYTSAPAGQCPIARPHWLPIPDLSKSNGEE